MSNILAKICADKRAHVERKKKEVPVSSFVKTMEAEDQPRGFISSLRAKWPSPALIAEIKKASPSSGLIRDPFDPPELAKAYQAGGAACLSILTDTPYFQGQDEYLVSARAACTLPVLRKDFMIDVYQVYESWMMRADCILLIMAALDDRTAQELFGAATHLGIDVLAEVHDAEELKRAVDLGAQMIGVHSRNLKTLKVDINTAFELVHLLPQSVLKVAESGIHSNDEIKRLQAAGYDAFLVGESLMRQPDVTAATRTLLDL